MTVGSRAHSRRAVIVGVGQYRRRPELDGPFEPWEPSRLMAEAIHRAVRDTGLSAADLAQVDTLACVDPVAWAYTDLCAATAGRAGISGTADITGASDVVGLTIAPGGNSPGELLNQIVDRIRSGDTRLAVLAGSECLYARRRAAKEQLPLGWTPFEGHRDFLKGQRPLANTLEARHGLTAPIHCYPLLENALRAASGRSIEEHQAFLGRLMARNAAVAAENPYAWFPIRYTPDDITTVSEGNRWVCFPYTKRMNAIMEVDLAAAIVVMSEDEADRRNIAASRRVTFLGGGSAADAWCVTERPSLTRSPAIKAAASAAFEHAGLGEDGQGANAVDRFDLYSCFPSAVQMGLDALGVAADDPRGATVTGGLAYAGGPGNSYSLHGLAAMTELIRNGSAGVGLVTSLGMTATKHAVTILSNDPARIAASEGGAHKVVLPDADVTGPPLADGVTGEGVVETYTVEFDRSGAPVRTAFVVRLDDGRRTVANGDCSTQEVRALTKSEGVGRRCLVTGGVPPVGELAHWQDDESARGRPNRAVLRA